ncbi:hypothetical protein [Halostella sp. PRR32]|uniref:hypothetical protein n=1 Tax=Halostella sp. PRR32 TaxID=3098147 RepID=UPI002B1D7CE9|nr:hypothetical protein [Halostella sp. PRR32]
MVFCQHEYLYVTAEAIHPGTTVHYDYRTGSSLATVIEKTDRHITLSSEDCHGKFNYDQINSLIDEGRLRVVLDDESHVDPEHVPGQ